MHVLKTGRSRPDRSLGTAGDVVVNYESEMAIAVQCLAMQKHDYCPSSGALYFDYSLFVLDKAF